MKAGHFPAKIPGQLSAKINTLGVKTTKGAEYHYYGVPRDVFEGMRAASSVGSYYNEHVKKPGYSYAKVG